MDSKEISNLRRLLQTTTQCITLELEAERMENEVTLLLLKEELKRDLMDRDANDAKTLDRQRIASERGEKFSVLVLRSKESVAQIDRDIATVCPWYRTRVCKSMSAFQATATDDEPRRHTDMSMTAAT